MSILKAICNSQVGEVVITKDDTLFLRGKGEQKDIDRRVETIRDQIESSTSDYEKEKMQERIAKMASGKFISTFNSCVSDYIMMIIL